MKKCKKCGEQMADTDTICNVCETPVDGASQKKGTAAKYSDANEWNPLNVKKGNLTIGDGFRIGVGFTLWTVIFGVIVYLFSRFMGYPIHL